MPTHIGDARTPGPSQQANGLLLNLFDASIRTPLSVPWSRRAGATLYLNNHNSEALPLLTLPAAAGNGYIKAILALLTGIAERGVYTTDGTIGEVMLRSLSPSGGVGTFTYEQASPTICVAGGFLHEGKPTYQAAVLRFVQSYWAPMSPITNELVGRWISLNAHMRIYTGHTGHDGPWTATAVTDAVNGNPDVANAVLSLACTLQQATTYSLDGTQPHTLYTAQARYPVKPGTVFDTWTGDQMFPKSKAEPRVAEPEVEPLVAGRDDKPLTQDKLRRMMDRLLEANEQADPGEAEFPEGEPEVEAEAEAQAEDQTETELPGETNAEAIERAEARDAARKAKEAKAKEAKAKAKAAVEALKRESPAEREAREAAEAEAKAKAEAEAEAKAKRDARKAKVSGKNVGRVERALDMGARIIMCVGPTGTGKTTLIENAAIEHDFVLEPVVLHPGVDAANLLGAWVKTPGSGDLAIVDGVVARWARRAAAGQRTMLMIDELARGHNSVVALLMSLMSRHRGHTIIQQGMELPAGYGPNDFFHLVDLTLTKERIVVPADLVAIAATANLGDRYMGIPLDDPALRRRFDSWLYMGQYDADEMRVILSDKLALPTTHSLINAMVLAYQQVDALQAETEKLVAVLNLATMIQWGLAYKALVDKRYAGKTPTRPDKKAIWMQTAEDIWVEQLCPISKTVLDKDIHARLMRIVVDTGDTL